MVAASFFSLILPALDMSSELGKFSFIPACVGFGAGMLFLLLLDILTPHMHINKSEEGPKTGLKRTTKLILAVTLHNLPEGMAVGIVCAGWLAGNEKIGYMIRQAQYTERVPYMVIIGDKELEENGMFADE